VAEAVHDMKCDQCGRLMYRASNSGVRYDARNVRPISVTIGVVMYHLCSRACLVNGIHEMSDQELTAGTGYRLPWGWPSGGEEQPPGEG